MSWGGRTLLNAAIHISVSEPRAVVALLRSRGTLLLSEGPFEFAPAGTSVSAVVIGS